MPTEQQMKAKRYLQQVHKINAMIDSKTEELKELRLLANSLPSSDFSKERVQETKRHDAQFTKYVISIVDLEKEIDEELAHLVQLKKEIRDKIYQVQNHNRLLVLQYRYVELLKWEDIAERLNYSLKQTHRIHNDALTDISAFIS